MNNKGLYTVFETKVAEAAMALANYTTSEMEKSSFVGIFVPIDTLNARQNFSTDNDSVQFDCELGTVLLPVETRNFLQQASDY